jgi:Concanavalin A-like lectin/glucanases superfamily
MRRGRGGLVFGVVRSSDGDVGRAGLGVWRVFVAAVVVVAALGVGAGTASADVLFSDGFESGDFSAWTLVKTGGGGSAGVQSSIVKSGSYAAELSESSASGSKAYVRETLATAQQDLTADGDFQVLQEGASGGKVPFFRFFTSGGTRIISLYRVNGTGKIKVSYGSTNVATSGTVALGTWANLQLHVITAGTASTVEVSLNGTLVYSTASASLGTTAAATVQIGNETPAQAFTIVADNITVQSGGPLSPPSNTAPPAIAGEAQQGQALSASPGSWSGTQPISFAYQWQRCDTSGANCTNIGSAGSTYVLTSSDVGSTIVVAVTASNSAGSGTAVSAATPVVQASLAAALWHMDETSGTTMFDSAGQNNGTLNSVTLGLPGFNGSAYGFNGSSSYVSVPSADSMNPGGANFSFTIDLQTTGTPPPPPADWDLIRKGDSTTKGGEYKMEFQHSGQASCGFKGSTSYAELAAGPALNDGQWHTITCVKTSSDIELIVDGQTFATPATVGSISNTAPVTIGSHPFSDWYQGSLDEAAISIGS